LVYVTDAQSQSVPLSYTLYNTAIEHQLELILRGSVLMVLPYGIDRTSVQCYVQHQGSNIKDMKDIKIHKEVYGVELELCHTLPLNERGCQSQRQSVTPSSNASRIKQFV
jgi:hypothetical protein